MRLDLRDPEAFEEWCKEVTMTEEQSKVLAAFKAVQEAYGDDAIIVYKPEGLDYYITTTAMIPNRSREVLRSIVDRMAKAYADAEYIAAQFENPEDEAAYQKWCAQNDHDCPRARFLEDPITVESGMGSEMVHLIKCAVCEAREKE